MQRRGGDNFNYNSIKFNSIQLENVKFQGQILVNFLVNFALNFDQFLSHGVEKFNDNLMELNLIQFNLKMSILGQFQANFWSILG